MEGLCFWEDRVRIEVVKRKEESGGDRQGLEDPENFWIVFWQVRYNPYSAFVLRRLGSTTQTLQGLPEFGKPCSG